MKSDFAMHNAPVYLFFGNRPRWLASALSHNVVRWPRVLALSEAG